MPAELHAESDPDPDPFFDAAEFFCANGDYERAAAELCDGDVYRKSQLGLDEAGVAALRAALVPWHMTMVEDGDHWIFADSRPDQRTTRCTFGPHTATGPNPWCCAQRRAYVLQYRSADTERPAFIDPKRPGGRRR
jgi:hypothetical protein